jgi:hypothetical protein
MQQYEIRVMNDAMKPTFSVNNGYASDDAAVIFAKNCAGDRAVEVWRDDLCIYRASPSGSQAERAA